MPLARIVYVSEIRIEAAERATEIAELREVSVRRNRRRRVTGALLCDERWFAQALEGEIDSVQELLQSILRDERHANLKITSSAMVAERLFGNWSMGYSARTLETEPLFGLHWLSVGQKPTIKTESSILKLMVELGRHGFLGNVE